MPSTPPVALRRPRLTVHPLADPERRIEAELVARNRQHFADAKGSPRDTYDAMTATTPLAGGLVPQEVRDGTVRGLWLRPADAPADRAILFVHGGGYLMGSARGYLGLASQLAVRTAVSVFVLDYPLAPEQPFPAAYDAVVAARGWLGRAGVDRVAMVGDSAGGGLVLAALAAAVPGAPRSACAVVFSPWTDLALTGESMNSASTHDPVFQRPMLAAAARAYLGPADPADPRASPLHGVPEGLPPLLVQVGQDELLLDDARRYAQRAAERGGDVVLDVFEGLHHVFQRAVAQLPSARRAMDDAAAFVTTHW